MFSSESVSFTFIDADGGSVPVTADVGKTLLDVAQENDVELEGVPCCVAFRVVLLLLRVLFLSNAATCAPPIAPGACGGELACSTCHLVFEKELFEKLPEISEEEEDMLDLAWGLTDTYVRLCCCWLRWGAERTDRTSIADGSVCLCGLLAPCRSRLGCQIKVTKDLEGATVRVPDESNNLM